jgi:hypothetical protein
MDATGTANGSVNSTEQIRKAQTELRRLDCHGGRVDGVLGDQTRQAELISDLADRGAGFCRLARRFFAVRAPLRPGGSPPFMRGARPPVVPAVAQPPAAAR